MSPIVCRLIPSLSPKSRFSGTFHFHPSLDHLIDLQPTQRQLYPDHLGVYIIITTNSTWTSSSSRKSMEVNFTTMGLE